MAAFGRSGKRSGESWVKETLDEEISFFLRIWQRNSSEGRRFGRQGRRIHARTVYMETERWPQRKGVRIKDGSSSSGAKTETPSLAQEVCMITKKINCQLLCF